MVSLEELNIEEQHVDEKPWHAELRYLLEHPDNAIDGTRWTYLKLTPEVGVRILEIQVSARLGPANAPGGADLIDMLGHVNDREFCGAPAFTLMLTALTTDEERATMTFDYRPDEWVLYPCPQGWTLYPAADFARLP